MSEQRYFQADISRLAERPARETWIGELVKCRCRHGIGSHSFEGCAGDFRGPCDCLLSRFGVIDVAVFEARLGK